MELTDFLKVIVNPDDANIDIVAVHGLNAKGTQLHAAHTWTAAGKEKTWLEDYLPNHLPNARVLLFSYNSNVVFTTSSAGVRQQAVKLLSLLKLERKGLSNGPNRRPIIFLCHSLGGLVVKKALVEAKQDESYNCIRLATYGIAFFATPHHGGNLAGFGDIAASIARHCLGNPDNTFLMSLKKSSLLNEELIADFRHQSEDFYFLSFYETRALKTIGIIVDRKSATLNLSAKREKQFPMDADHSSICKFHDDTSTNYKQVIGALCELVEDALKSTRSLLPLVHFSLPVELSDGPSEPVFICPYSLNPHFIHRQSIFEKVKLSLEPTREDRVGQRKTAVLYGLGGTGKSQLAIAYTYWMQQSYPGTSILWVHASNFESFHLGYLEIARKYRVRGYDDPDVDILSVVKDLLEHIGNWILILDNVDDVETFFRVGQDDLESYRPAAARYRRPKLMDYLPTTTNGRILITTRTLEVAVKISNCYIEVPSMEKSEAIDLLKSFLPGSGLSTLQNLASILQHLPLALTQAAAYIRQTSLTIDEYLQMYNESEESAVKLLSQRFEDGGRDPSIPNAVATSWMVSFDVIKKSKPRAAELLSVMALLDSQAILPALLTDEQEPTLEFKEAIGTLLAYSFVTKDETTGYFSMHRLVHVISRCWVEYHQETSKWVSVFQKRILKRFWQDTKRDQVLCEKYLLHVKAAIQHGLRAKSNDSYESLHVLMQLAETVFLEISNSKASHEISEQHLNYCLQHRGPQHVDTLMTLSNLAEILILQGQYALAEKMYYHALMKLRKMLPPSNCLLVHVVTSHARSLAIRGRHEEAEKAQRRALAECEKLLGPESHLTLMAKNSVAMTVVANGHPEEAEVILSQIVEVRKRVFGSHDPYTLGTMTFLALVKSHIGKHTEAGELFKEVQLLQQKGFKPGNRALTVTLHHFAVHLINVGELTQGIAILRQILSERELTLAPGHADLLVSMIDLANSLCKIGEYVESEDLYRRVLAQQESLLGLNHSFTLKSLQAMANILEKQGRHAEAKSFKEEAETRTAARKVVREPEKPVPYNLSPAFQQLLYEDAQFKKKRLRLRFIYPPILNRFRRNRLSSTFQARVGFTADQPANTQNL